MTRITVGVTVKDDRAGMGTLLRALRAQARLPDELVIVDAASRDGTLELCEAFAKDAPFPVRVESAPCTRGGGRRRIVDLASGDLVAFTDSDCEPPPGWLAGFEAAWSAAPAGTVALGGPNVSPGGATRVQRAVEDVMAHTEAASFGGVNTCNALYDRAALLRAGNFDASLQTAEDPDMNARLKRAGGRVARADVTMLQRRRGTWGALARQHYEYGKGAWVLLQRYPEDFPRIERWMGLLLLALALVGLALAPAGLLVTLAALVGAPLFVHRRLALRHPTPAHWLALWMLYIPYHAGIVVARLTGLFSTAESSQR